ncbi:ABC-type glycerol-3-phosphate transport system substrate-binding protein [Pantoea alhagi]|nr:ABC-type glycerol-3-phosphate transport system substrate-binding protein [Pantoea alhagi]
MMKKTALLAFAFAAALPLAGCSSSNYTIHTNDGRTIVSDGKPKEDNATGLIKYKDANGNEQQINRSDVKSMTEIPH